MGSVYRRKHSRNLWISYQKDGRQHRESAGTTNKRLAKKILSVREAQVFEQRWRLPRSTSPRFGMFVKQFLRWIAHEKTEKTKERYEQSARNLIGFYGENIRLAEITPESIFNFQQMRLEKGVSKATVNRDTTALSSCLKRAHKMGLISRNPCRIVDQLEEKSDRREAKPLSYAEEAKLKLFSPPWLAVLITFLAETGLRVKSEALGLRWSDIFLESEPARLHVRKSKTVAGLRTVWLTSHCKNVLVEWRKMMGPDFSPYVFPSPRIAGAPISDYKTAWRTAARKAGLADRRIYDLRATFATRANFCRASGQTVAQLLGQASTRILPTYVKPMDENTKAVIEALDAARIAASERGSIQ